MEVVLAEKYGFCAGVRVADKMVRLAAARGLSGGILGQVVHNESVEAEMARLREADQSAANQGSGVKQTIFLRLPDGRADALGEFGNVSLS